MPSREFREFQATDWLSEDCHRPGFRWQYSNVAAFGECDTRRRLTFPLRIYVDRFHSWVGHRISTTFVGWRGWQPPKWRANGQLKGTRYDRGIQLTRLLVAPASVISLSSCWSRFRSVSSESRKESRCAVSSSLAVFLSLIDFSSLWTSCGNKWTISIADRWVDGAAMGVNF